MSRRRQPESELPFVAALMDTMTNVVGVLTIVLVMIGISLASAVNKVLSELPPATPAQVQTAQTVADKLRAVVKALEEQLKQLTTPAIPPAAELEKEIARLEQEIKLKGIKFLDIESLAKELAKREEELKKKQEEATRLVQERDRLKALLAATPVIKPPEAKVVRIPDSRPVPDGAVKQYILVTGDGLTYFDVDGARATYAREFLSANVQSCVFERRKVGATTRVIFDQTKLADYFSKRKLQYRNLLLTPKFDPSKSYAVITLTPTPGTGEKPAQFNVPGSPFEAALRKIKFNPKNVVMFKVTADGFENYLLARDIADRIGVPAGWDFQGDQKFTQTFGVYDIPVNVLVKPVPTPTPKPGAIPKAVDPLRERLD